MKRQNKKLTLYWDQDMEYDYLFPSILGRIKLDEDDSGIFDFCQNKKQESKGRIRSNQDGGWQSNDLTWEEIEEFPAMTSLLESIGTEANQYKNDIGWRIDAHCFVENWWININSRNSMNSLHIHPLCCFSGAYYVHADPEVHGPIVFRTPLHARMGMIDSRLEPNSELQDHNPTTAESWQYPPETGNLLIFPSWLEHYVNPSKTDDERISISFNIMANINEDSS